MRQARGSVRRNCFALVLASGILPLELGCGSGSGLSMTLDGGRTVIQEPDAGGSPGSSVNPPSSSGASGDDGSSNTDPASNASDAFAPSTPEVGASCQGGGSVPPSQIAMIGDSYLDPAWCLAGNDIMANARAAGSLAMGASYRQYQLGGASMAWGNPYTNFYIPYQYENTLMNDLAYMNPKVIDTIIMDGGGNDVLIGNSSCETTAPPGNTSCLSTVNSAIMRAQSLLQEMANNGVKHIVYIFYPHLDPAGGGILTTPAPAVNDSLDYAYPLAEQILLRVELHLDGHVVLVHGPHRFDGRHGVQLHRHAPCVRGAPRRLHQVRPRSPHPCRRASHCRPRVEGDAGPLHRSVGASETRPSAFLFNPPSCPRSAGPRRPRGYGWRRSGRRGPRPR